MKSVTKASREMIRHFTQFHSYQELALALCKVNDLLSKIKLSGPQRQTHMDDYFLKWTVNCYSFCCISRAYLLSLPVMYFNKMWIWPNPKFIFSGPVLSRHPVLNRHFPKGVRLIQVWLYIHMIEVFLLSQSAPNKHNHNKRAHKTLLHMSWIS